MAMSELQNFIKEENGYLTEIEEMHVKLSHFSINI
jgi:hypothetical protein